MMFVSILEQKNYIMQNLVPGSPKEIKKTGNFSGLELVRTVLWFLRSGSAL